MNKKRLNILVLLLSVFIGESVMAHTEAPSPEIPSSIILCGENISLDRNDMYERFDRELTSLIYGHSNTLLMLKRANKYFPIIAPILKENNIPEDFLYLACIESTLNPRAYSPAKAAGFWQFIPSTAKQYGLEVNDEVDERYDIEKSTIAACKYFHEAYKKYHGWATVMASFNAGMGRISKELDNQLQNSAFNLYLNEETSRYVFRIMALALVFRDPKKYGFIISPDQFYRYVVCDKVSVTDSVENWTEWAQDRGITYAQLKEENPWIRSNSLTNKNGKTYVVRVPRKESLRRSTSEAVLYNNNWSGE